LDGGINSYTYVENRPAVSNDPLGLRTLQCTKPLDALSPKWGPFGYKYGPLLYHQYSCVIGKNGKVTCGGKAEEMMVKAHLVMTLLTQLEVNATPQYRTTTVLRSV
jgi:hypothetical protein